MDRLLETWEMQQLLMGGMIYLGNNNGFKKMEDKYLYFKEFCVLHRNPIPTVEFYNRKSTPKNLLRVWEKHDERKKSAINRIKELMNKYNIKKTEI